MIMKAKFASLLVVFLTALTAQLPAQRSITVEATNDDISYYLDLKAVASIFGESRNLEDFERRLNDYDSQISNLDLNGDGKIDYLRVIETSENNVHLIVIQAILDRDVFQDVATIVVERDRYKRSYIQIIGDPYMYGYNYIIEPVYIRVPRIISWFWTPRYHRWHSPYYWGYYPDYYRYRRPIEINLYLSNIHKHINYNHHYRYTENRRNQNVIRLQSSISRNDYGNKYPDRNFNNRHSDVKNRHEFETRSSSNSRNYQNNGNNGNRGVYNENTRRQSSGNRTEYGTKNDNKSRAEREARSPKPQVTTRPSTENRSDATRNANSKTYDRSSNSNSNNSSVNRGSNSGQRESRSDRQATVNRAENKDTKVTRESSNRTQQTVQPSKPSKENRNAERKQESKPKNNDSKNDNSRNRDSRSDSRR